MNVSKLISAIVLSLVFGSELVVAAELDRQGNGLGPMGSSLGVGELSAMAKQGHSYAQYNLGVIYNNAIDVPRDYKAAVKWHTLAAEQGHHLAQFSLGVLYSNGRGVARDLINAAQWYTKAAEQGDFLAQYYLAEMHELGIGIPQNNKAAIRWYKKAAKQGHVKAQYRLGNIYKRGAGVQIDYVKSCMWFNLAEHNGYEHNSAHKEIMTKKMTSVEIYKAQDMASRCLDSGYKDC